MYYSSVGVLALIIHLIINKEILKPVKNRTLSESDIRYRQFQYSVMGYYVTDILWGLFTEAHLIAFAYADTVLYFLLMVLSVLLWIRYVIVYLNKEGRFNSVLKYAGYAIYIFVALHLVVNFFNPIIFTFDADGVYVPGSARHLTFILQFVLYTLTGIYTFFTASKTEGKDKIHNMAVGFTCIAMDILIILQVFNPLLPFYAMGCLIEICIIHSFFEQDEKLELDLERKESAVVQKEKEVYNQIATSLAEDYEAIYYINIETGKFREFSASERYEAMNVPKDGEDFYVETHMNCARYVHPDDRAFAQSLYHKDTMLRNLEGRHSYSYKYRVMVNGEARFFSFTVMMAQDGRHFVLYEKDIQDQITAETIQMENQKQHATFGQIAESLASNYDLIYYVDVADGNYVTYETNNIFGLLEMRMAGDDFFNEAKENIPKIVHKSDRERVLGILNKDFLITSLENKNQYNLDYRIMVNGERHHTRLSVRMTSDRSHFIMGVENIDKEVQKEKEHLRALNTEKELARRDELTGTKNKMAYAELEQSVQGNIDNGMDYLPFGIVVCDINNLKIINDTEGHKAGDEYIKTSAKLLCDIFDHSPVFRVGGDEFVIFLRGDDYTNRKDLMNKIRTQVKENNKKGEGPVIAVGMAEYEPEEDSLVSDIFERADNKMYADKQKLKAKV